MSTFRLIVALLWPLLVFGGLLIVPAPTTWWRAWAFLGVLVLASLLGARAVAKVNPAAVDARFEPPLQRGQPLADKIVVVAFLIAFLGVVAFVPIDVFEARLLPRPSPPISFGGLLVFVAGMQLITLALRENPFAAPVVKHQRERHQTVVDTGPYGIVRHPMYAGVALLLVGMTLWLESYAAAVLATVPIALLAVRILVEERLLRRELPGYGAYTARVRYRLLPFVW